jgi:hypothetical protein
MARTWDGGASASDEVATATIRDRAGQGVRVHASFLMLLPGLHAAALATSYS